MEDHENDSAQASSGAATPAMNQESQPAMNQEDQEG